MLEIACIKTSDSSRVPEVVRVWPRSHLLSSLAHASSLTHELIRPPSRSTCLIELQELPGATITEGASGDGLIEWLDSQ